VRTVSVMRRHSPSPCALLSLRGYERKGLPLGFCFRFVVCVLGVLGVRFLPIVGHSGFLLRSVFVLVGVVVLVVGIRIVCFYRSFCFHLLVFFFLLFGLL